MAEKFYTAERQIQALISLLKQYGIKKIIASPGTTNLTFVASVQQDPFFEIFSAPEERSGAYMAVGMAEESNESVVITCTGATASRNYLPALTEAYYRKLPVIAVTATQPKGRVGQLVPQVIDRAVLPLDTNVYSYNLPVVKDEADFREAVIYINEALHHLTMNGGGPVHINMETSYSSDFSVKELPEVLKINFYDSLQGLPEIPVGKIGIFVGSHSLMNDELTSAIDEFCEAYDAALFCDDTSNYYGKFKIQYPLLLSQDNWHCNTADLSLMIYLGEVSGAYSHPSAKMIWRVNTDGMIRSVFGAPDSVFKMEELDFFNYYKTRGNRQSDSFVKELNSELDGLFESIPEDLPFSNVWAAKTATPLLPSDSVLNLGILNSLRAWNYFRLPEGVVSYSNVGGFGIDGAISTTIGGALAKPDKLHFLVVGDLAFFYDMNSLGNRHLPSNIRILLVNNGRGTEFRNYNHPGFLFGENADDYIAAGGHYGNQSKDLVRHYAEDLGFIYLSASNKEEFLQNIETFTDSKTLEKPILLEVFTTQKDENDAVFTMRNLRKGTQTMAQNLIRKTIGPKGVQVVKKIIGK